MKYLLKNEPNSDHINKLMKAAILICKAWGVELSRIRETHREPCSWNVYEDINTDYFLICYKYVGEKISISVGNYPEGIHGDTIDFGGWPDIVITVRGIEATVFEVRGFDRTLRIYRSGRWEEYLLSMKKDAKIAIKHEAQRRFQEQLEHEKARFAPIDDSHLF